MHDYLLIVPNRHVDEGSQSKCQILALQLWGLYIEWKMLTNVLTAIVNNSFKKKFIGKEKKNN